MVTSCSDAVTEDLLALIPHVSSEGFAGFCFGVAWSLFSPPFRVLVPHTSVWGPRSRDGWPRGHGCLAAGRKDVSGLLTHRYLQVFWGNASLHNNHSCRMKAIPFFVPSEILQELKPLRRSSARKARALQGLELFAKSEMFVLAKMTLFGLRREKNPLKFQSIFVFFCLVIPSGSWAHQRNPFYLQDHNLSFCLFPLPYGICQTHLL